ncbi:MAG: hypothetical protein ABI165_07340 [Bryobacteraceae bacterium]
MAAGSSFSWEEYPEIAELLRDRNLSFPIPTKEDFVDQMTRSGTPVVFRKTSYDPHFAAGLMPEFFFPVVSPDDLLQKGVELMIARGLFKIPGKAAEPTKVVI